MTILERFMEKVMPEPMSGCWLWTASVGTHGYGAFGTHRKVTTAHRWAYEHFVGPVPEGLELDHLCHTRICVNPAHLEAVSHQVNVDRGEGNQHRGKPRCHRGHEFTEANTHVSPDGRRHCRPCHRERNRAYRDRRRATT